MGRKYVKVTIKLRPDDPLLDFLRKKAVNGEPLGRVVKRELRRIMFMDRYAHDNKNVASALRLVYRKARELGVITS